MADELPIPTKPNPSPLTLPQARYLPLKTTTVSYFSLGFTPWPMNFRGAEYETGLARPAVFSMSLEERKLLSSWAMGGTWVSPPLYQQPRLSIRANSVRSLSRLPRGTYYHVSRQLTKCSSRARLRSSSNLTATSRAAGTFEHAWINKSAKEVSFFAD